MVTTGQLLIVGDMHALLARLCTAADSDAVTICLGWRTDSSATVLDAERYTILTSVLRTVFPVPACVFADLVFTPKEGEDPADFLRRAADSYTKWGKPPPHLP